MRGWWIWVALAGCGGGDDADDTSTDFPRACDQSTVDGDCVLYDGSDWLAEDVTGNCVGGTVTAVCPPAGAVGSCTVDPGPFQTVSTFYTPFWTASAGVQACQSQGGSWSEP